MFVRERTGSGWGDSAKFENKLRDWGLVVGPTSSRKWRIKSRTCSAVSSSDGDGPQKSANRRAPPASNRSRRERGGRYPRP